MSESKKLSYKDQNQTSLDFDKLEKESIKEIKEIKDFGGFSSAQERINTARKYKVISDEGIEDFFKTSEGIFHKNFKGKLEPVDDWFIKEDEFYKESPGDYFNNKKH